MSNKSKIPGCFKFGCFGCLGVFAMMVALMLIAGAVQLSIENEDPSPEQREAAHDLPEPPELTTPLPGGDTGGGDTSSGDTGSDQPEVPEILPLPEAIEPPPTDAVGTIILDLTMGHFEIRPGPAGEPIRVEADYDSNAFELREDFQEENDGAWTYKVTFGGRGGLLGSLFRGGGDAGRNRIEVIIPRGHPVDIVGKIGMGESETDLGGLWVRRVDLETSAGDHFLEFREPLPFPMDEFRVDGSMGSLEIRTLGEASPKAVDVEQGMGELLVDLEGMWRRDAEIDISFSMGGCRLWLPKNARVDIAKATMALGEKNMPRLDQSDLPADAPVLTLRASGSMGELRIED